MAAITNPMQQKMDGMILRIYDDVNKDTHKLDQIFKKILAGPRDNLLHTSLGLQHQRAIDAVAILHRLYNDPDSEDGSEMSVSEKKKLQQEMQSHYDKKLLELFRGAVTQSNPAPSTPVPIAKPPAAATPAPTSAKEIPMIDVAISDVKTLLPAGQTIAFANDSTNNKFKLSNGTTVIFRSGCNNNHIVLVPNSKVIIEDGCSNIFMEGQGGKYEVGKGCQNIILNGQPVNQSGVNEGFRLPSAVELRGADGERLIIYQ